MKLKAKVRNLKAVVTNFQIVVTGKHRNYLRLQFLLEPLKECRGKQNTEPLIIPEFKIPGNTTKIKLSDLRLVLHFKNYRFQNSWKRI